MNSQLEKARKFLRKDSGDDNESTKLRYVVRIILILCVAYNILSTLGNGIYSDGEGLIYHVIFFGLFVIVFVLSYFLKTMQFLVTFNLSVLVWCYASVRLFGWGTGIQMLLVVLLVLAFFSGHKKYWLKISYAVFLFVVRIVFFYISQKYPPLYATDDVSVFSGQVLNSIFSFTAIATLCFIFSRESQALEGKLVEYNVQLVNQANTDPLTGLNNRRRTMEKLESLISDGRTSGLCVAIADIDFFKKVNDTYGHDIGDKVLKSIAQTMRNSLGEECFISRWGGEEFLIVFPNINGDNAYVMLQNLRNAISKLHFEVKDRSFCITLTFGLSEYDFRSDIQSLIKEADGKLYIGKENGRDQVVF